jgi:hypothetical protein
MSTFNPIFSDESVSAKASLSWREKGITKNSQKFLSLFSEETAADPLVPDDGIRKRKTWRLRE